MSRRAAPRRVTMADRAAMAGREHSGVDLELAHAEALVVPQVDPAAARAEAAAAERVVRRRVAGAAEQRELLAMLGLRSADPAPPAPPRPIAHGTHRGYVAHQRRGEAACGECRAAHSAYTADRHRLTRVRRREARDA
ncbi:hypothetical protein [Allonocardiopsis opalescens]|uniref:Uncharacterized protein n=1 Tax=Allonocardiopsis opalescens TaxID=1144618 RepID=A0A2T0PVN9_9ACTN|nr:hypothetical protein [Allonocardiopsis opalescens]PRX95605.1 hypothetical protein CLV72_109214 [Allonocardiopsis opalescens]